MTSFSLLGDRGVALLFTGKKERVVVLLLAKVGLFCVVYVDDSKAGERDHEDEGQPDIVSFAPRGVLDFLAIGLLRFSAPIHVGR